MRINKIQEHLIHFQLDNEDVKKMGIDGITMSQAKLNVLLHQLLGYATDFLSEGQIVHAFCFNASDALNIFMTTGNYEDMDQFEKLELRSNIERTLQDVCPKTSEKSEERYKKDIASFMNSIDQTMGIQIPKSNKTPVSNSGKRKNRSAAETAEIFYIDIPASSFDEIAAYARPFHRNIYSQLIKKDGRYHLIVGPMNNPDIFSKADLLLCEYVKTRKISSLVKAIYEEHGAVVIQDNAVKKLQMYLGM